MSFSPPVFFVTVSYPPQLERAWIQALLLVVPPAVSVNPTNLMKTGTKKDA